MPASASNMKEMMGYLLASALPTRPISSGALDLRLSPAYDYYTLPPSTQGSGEWKLSGYGVGASAVYAFTGHWAATGMFGYGELSGTDGQGNTPRSTGYVATANAIYDPFSGDDFRLPIMAGLGYRNMVEEDAVCSVGVCFDAKGLALDAGAAPQVNTGFLRWILFGYLLTGEPSPRLSGPAGLASDPSQNIAGGAGLSVVYRPWNLGVTYIPAAATNVAHGETNSVYALTFQRRLRLGPITGVSRGGPS